MLEIPIGIVSSSGGETPKGILRIFEDSSGHEINFYLLFSFPNSINFTIFLTVKIC